MTFPFFSDHAPIQFTISSKVNTVLPEQQCEIKKILWDADKVTEFRDVLNTNLDTLETCINNIVCQNSNIDDGVNNFAHTLYVPFRFLVKLNG